MQVVCNANKLAKLVEEKKSKQNWLDYYQLKYSRKPSQRPTMKVTYLLHFYFYSCALSFLLLSFFLYSAFCPFTDTVVLSLTDRLVFLASVELKSMQLIIRLQKLKDYQKK